MTYLWLCQIYLRNIHVSIKVTHKRARYSFIESKYFYFLTSSKLNKSSPAGSPPPSHSSTARSLLTLLKTICSFKMYGHPIYAKYTKFTKRTTWNFLTSASKQTLTLKMASWVHYNTVQILKKIIKQKLFFKKFD